MHRPLMRRLVLSLTLVIAACAPRVETPPVVSQPVPVPQPERARPSVLTGLSAQELVQHLGHPALQIREGTSLKLQFRSRRCVLDAFLYPPENSANGVLRVTYIDTRLPSGAAADQAACISALENPS
jgi:hypothetical protein